MTGDCQARFREKGGVKLPSTYSTSNSVKTMKRQDYRVPEAEIVMNSLSDCFLEVSPGGNEGTGDEDW